MAGARHCRIAWDSRPKAQGGQRWFHLYPNEEIKHDDVLHWTKLNQNWNFMCAECHSTGVRKNYDAATDQFATSFAEISVGCEACHGQGSRHVAWARDQKQLVAVAQDRDPAKGLIVKFDERKDIVWRHNPTTGKSQRNFAPPLLRKEVETCGLCHARRGEFSEKWMPGRSLSETHVVSPLARDLYHADGQMRDEVYNYGSFKQSKMFAAGVTCSDCHEPHSAKLRLRGDGVCLQCHAPDKYAAAAHHHHEGVNPPLACASCHMPARTYMVVDRRHDHSFRIPRPDLSVRLGTPNACNDCHADKSARWAAAAIESWHGPDRKGFQKYAQAFHAAWTDRRTPRRFSPRWLSDRKAPAFARAERSDRACLAGCRRGTSISRAAALPIPIRWCGSAHSTCWKLAACAALAAGLAAYFRIPVRGVRSARVAARGVPAANQPAADRERFEHAAEEFIAAQRLNADRPEARATLGNFYARRGARTRRRPSTRLRCG